jgi:4a-hydroxytetrahydrobiopterin dehydratase
MSLAQEKCVPCVKGEGKLNDREVEDMLKELPEWVAEGAHLVKRVNFKNFVEALAYVNKLGDLAEAENHHPDTRFGWGYAEIELTSHDAGGITRNDFIMAAKIDTIK